MRYHILTVLQRTGLVLTAVILLFVYYSWTSDGSVREISATSASGAPIATAKPEVKEVDPAVRALIEESYGKLPLSFEANNGQVDEEVRYLSRGNGYTLFLTSTEAALSLRRGSSKEKREFAGRASKSNETEPLPNAVVRLKLVGANPNPRMTGFDELPGRSNYFIGNDPEKWHRDVSNYAKVKVEEAYAGIDLVYYGNQRQLEYDWIVAPGADPAAIRFTVEGKSDPRIDAEGNLILDEKGELYLHKPVVYQQAAGVRSEVAGEYVLFGKNQVGIRLGAYDTSLPLVIDPVLSYSTYLGGLSGDYAYGIAVDSSGNAYVTGSTYSSNFPTENPYQANRNGYTDVFITKFNASGNALLYSTYLGGPDTGNSEEYGFDIAVDSSGNAYVTGSTFSTGFPTVNPYQGSYGGGWSDAFVTKLNASGNDLIYSTYLGGEWEEEAYGIALDSSGNAYVTGYTVSTNFPTANPYQGSLGGGGEDTDAFVTKLNASGNDLVYSTYLGGEAWDEAYGIAVDSSGNAYMTGFTHSDDFPTQNPYQGSTGGNFDAFITKLNSSGNGLVYSSYLGGIDDDGGFGIAIDSSGNAYVTGSTYSTNFPTENPYQGSHGGGGDSDAFVTKLNSSGSGLVYSTYLGGYREEEGYGIAVDSSGAAYVTGYTVSSNFPTEDPIQANIDPGWCDEGIALDAFITKFNTSGSGLISSTYLGGNSCDLGRAIAVDASGGAYVTGETRSSNFPTSNPFQANLGASFEYDAFIAKIGFPFISRSPVELSQSVPLGQDAQSQSFNVWNSGSGTLDYTITDDVPWLSCDPASGTSTGEQDSIQVNYSTSGLSVGIYNGTITIDAPDIASATVPVTLTVMLAAPTGLNPPNGATNIPLTPTLYWNPSLGADSYDLYFGTTSPPPFIWNTDITTFYLSALSPLTTYYWRVEAKNASGSASSPIISFTTTGVVPGEPTGLSPADGATGVELAPTLSWNAATGADSYDVYFGTAPSPPLAAEDTAGTTYDPGTLNESTTYYWRVKAKNAFGSTSSDTVSFSTGGPPIPPTGLMPGNGSTDVALDQTLSWNTSTGADSYDVYFGTTASPPLLGNTAGTTYDPGALNEGTVYHWKVVAKNSFGTGSSSVISFTTGEAPPPPTGLNPIDGATGVTLDQTLSWNASTGADSYDVYFGTTASPPLLGNTAGTTYDPGPLNEGTVYHWKVVAKNSFGTGSSSVISFTTGEAPPPPTGLSPEDGAADVALDQTLSWNASTGADSYDVYFGTTASPPLLGNTAGTTYDPGALNEGTVYHWKVVAKNSFGSASSDIVQFTTTPPVATYELTVNSENPESGITITVSPPDNNDEANGATDFTRTYDDGAYVELTAPETNPEGNPFMKWELDGEDYSSEPVAYVEMDADHTMTAVYWAVYLTDLEPTEDPRQSTNVGVGLGMAAPADMTGTLELTFSANPSVDGLPEDYVNPQLQFAAGGTALDFEIEEGTEEALLDNNGDIQQGTVAGTITAILTRLMAGATSVLPQPAPSRSIEVPLMVPVIELVEIVDTSAGFNVTLTGYSTPRDLVRARFTFRPATGTRLNGTSFTVDLGTIPTEYFSSESGLESGSTFELTQPFTFSGDRQALGSVTVTLENSIGTSEAQSADF